MSGWIKVEKDLKDDSRVLRMASRLRNADVTLGSRALLIVVGALVTLWWYADTHIREDDTLDLGPDEVDDIVGLPGFCDLAPDDWLRKVSDECVELPGFQAHNGLEAKKKALGQKRQSRLRDKRNADSVTTPLRLALPDQTRPDKTKTRPKEEKAQAPPPDLDSAAWTRWIAYRHDIRKPLKPASIPAAQLALAAFGSAQMAVVEQSIANGWQGLFHLKTANGSGDHRPKRSAKSAAELEAEEVARNAQH